MQPNKGSFPSRNRIIAGLSLGVVVTEGAEDSGRLITANDAFKHGRKVFGVPGPITASLSKGPLSLIGKGAKLVTSADDILKDLGCTINTSPGTGDLPRGKEKKKKVKGDTKEEQKIIDVLQNQNLHFDELVRETKIDSSVLGGNTFVDGNERHDCALGSRRVWIGRYGRLKLTK